MTLKDKGIDRMSQMKTQNKALESWKNENVKFELKTEKKKKNPKQKNSDFPKVHIKQ